MKTLHTADNYHCMVHEVSSGKMEPFHVRDQLQVVKDDSVALNFRK